MAGGRVAHLFYVDVVSPPLGGSHDLRRLAPGRASSRKVVRTSRILGMVVVIGAAARMKRHAVIVAPSTVVSLLF